MIKQQSKQAMDLIRNNCFPNDVVIIDGQGRSGKNLIAVLLSTMKKVGKMRLDSQIDYVPRYWSLGKMTEDAAIVALRTEFDEKLYYDAISRDVNFRKDDYSGVFKQGRIWPYIKRLFISAGPETRDQIISDQRIFQEMTHDGIQFFDLYIKVLGPRLKFIHVIRNPIHNIFEQNRRGLGDRIGLDPTELQLVFSFQGHSVPLMALGAEELWLKGNELERLTVMVNAMFRKNCHSLNKFRTIYPDQILILEFERFVQEPGKSLRKIENFIGQPFERQANRILRREKCPRIIGDNFVTERVSAIRSKLGVDYQSILDEMLLSYDQLILEMGLP